MTRRILKFWLKVGVSVGLLTLLALMLPWHEVIGSLKWLSLGEWALVLVGVIAGHALGVIKWRLLLNVGHAAIGRLDAALCYSAGLFANVCLPSIVGGDVLRMTLAGKFTRRPEAAFLGGVLDRVTDMVALSLLVVLGALTSRSSLPGWGYRLVGVLLLILAALFGLALPFMLRRPLDRWPRRLRRPVGRSLVVLRRAVREPKCALGGLVLSVTIQGGFVLLNAVFGRELGIHVPLSVWFLVWPLVKVSGVIPISLGGLAVRETTLGALLTPFGVPFALGVLCALLWQTMLIATSLLGGLVWVVLTRIRNGGTMRPMAVIHQVTRAEHG